MVGVIGLGCAWGVRSVVGIAGDGVVVLELVGYRGLAGAVVVVGRGRVAGRQPFHPLAQLGADWVGLAGAHRVGGLFVLGRPVSGCRHEATFRTFGDRAIVAG